DADQITLGEAFTKIIPDISGVFQENYRLSNGR
ncbi:hypothetical protein A2U01_0073447, partial [Trifolium medium]|nr:hypothetical protein [Trifolium medium]